MTWVEFIGYSASVLVAVSLMMVNIKHLRWINLTGAITFSVYGYLISAYPVLVVNGWIACVNLYFLWRLYRFKDQFDLVHETSAAAPVYSLLLSRYWSDIKQYFPGLSTLALKDADVVLIFRNMKPVGLFAYKPDGEEQVAEVLMDYVIPEARDLKTAQYFFDQHSQQLRDANFTALKARSSNSAHTKYLLKMGFVAHEDEYQLAL